MKHRHIKTIVYLALTLVIMVKYQNCAPARPINTQNKFVPSDQVSVIDNIHKGTALSFVEQEVQVSNQFLATYVVGHCDVSQNGAVMSWNISRQLSGISETSGTAKCESGVFTVPLNIEAMDCESIYHVRAEFGFDKGAELEVKKRCPDKFESLDDLRMAQLGAICFIEQSADNTCTKSCYQEGKIFSDEPAVCSN